MAARMGIASRMALRSGRAAAVSVARVAGRSWPAGGAGNAVSLCAVGARAAWLQVLVGAAERRRRAGGRGGGVERGAPWARLPDALPLLPMHHPPPPVSALAAAAPRSVFSAPRAQALRAFSTSNLDLVLSQADSALATVAKAQDLIMAGCFPARPSAAACVACVYAAPREAHAAARRPVAACVPHAAPHLESRCTCPPCLCRLNLP